MWNKPKEPKKCSACNGKGVIYQYGKMMRCGVCNGKGEVEG